ncbi:MAG: right-handed parallel beta-helix repeat-containing protein, partial [Planctomycetia bacterium]|nr:right-handed parallel beta-helix repeat-containing protein [Planctomycetia bacterium]
MKAASIWTFLFLLIFSVSATAATYYIDSSAGSDDRDGLSPKTAWKTIGKVNKAEIKPGDKILFVRGGLWREVLIPQSGEEGNRVYYGAYGEGDLPKLYGSMGASSPEDWTEVQPGIWATRMSEPVIGKEFNTVKKGDLSVQGDNKWRMHHEAGAAAKITTVGSGFKLECEKPGTAAHHIHIWGPSVSRTFSESGLQVTFKARCSKPFKMNGFRIQKAGPPFTSFFASSNVVSLTPEWKEFTTFLFPNAENTDTVNSLPKNTDIRYHWTVGGMPADSVLEFEFLNVSEATLDMSKKLPCDVGNIIFDHGKCKDFLRSGIKKWNLEDCKKPGDYWFNPDDQRVYLRFDGNPASKFKSIELALRRTIINEGGRHDLLFENLAVAYGASHGFGGGSTQRITIRKCDIYYIGGGHFYTRENGVPSRYGNGIEFWGDCDGNLVEENRIWEIYDAALTNQGRNDTEVNIIYRKNLIWNAEYSYEYWNAKTTENILFEDNI